MTSRFLVTLTSPDGELIPVEVEATDESHAKDLVLHQYHGHEVYSVEKSIQPRHPEVVIETKHLAKYPITATSAALRIGGVSLEEIREFSREAESDLLNYPDSALNVIRKWVTVK